MAALAFKSERREIMAARIVSCAGVMFVGFFMLTVLLDRAGGMHRANDSFSGPAASGFLLSFQSSMTVM